MGANERLFLARVARGIRSLTGGLLPLCEMVAGRSLAAHSGDAPVLANYVASPMLGVEMAL